MAAVTPLQYFLRPLCKQHTQLSVCSFIAASSPNIHQGFAQTQFRKTHSARSKVTAAAQHDSPHIIKSPHPDVTLPKKPFTEYMFSYFKNYGDLPALTDFPTGKIYTFKQMQDASIRVASALYRSGYRKGDRILMFSRNCPEYAILCLACGALGVVITTANPSYTAGELARHVEHSGAVAVMSAEKLLGTVNGAVSTHQSISSQVKDIFVLGEADGCRPFSSLLEDDGKAFPENVDIDPMEDVLVLPYSSGTTGLPKGVMLTHYNITSNVQQLSAVLPYTAGKDSLLGILPQYHIYGLVVSQFVTTVQGANVIIVPRFTPEHFLTAIQKHKITKLQVVPPLALFLAKDPMVSEYDISSVNAIMCGAAPLGEGTSVELFERTGASFVQAYGLTETSPVTHIDTPPAKFGSVGYLVPNTEGKVLDVTTGEPLGIGKAGEICVRGPQVMKGYLDNPKATSDMIKGGWLHTGDIGYCDEDGYFTVTDRMKELIKYKGFQVAPAELEALILTHPDVQDVAIIGVPSGEAGELPKAFIVPKPNSTVNPEDISDFVAKNTAAYKRLRGGVEITDIIPKTPSGKILRRFLKSNQMA